MVKLRLSSDPRILNRRHFYRGMACAAAAPLFFPKFLSLGRAGFRGLAGPFPLPDCLGAFGTDAGIMLQYFPARGAYRFVCFCVITAFRTKYIIPSFPFVHPPA